MYSIVYTSRTGNTALLARTLRRCLPEEECRYFGPPVPEIPETPLVLAGFWTDKGDCSPELSAFLAGLHGRTVALFGTAGFGGSAAYFHAVLDRAARHVPPDNVLLPGFLCQGKMPPAVRERYAAAGLDDKVAMFDAALPHPDGDDLEALRAWATGLPLFRKL